MGTTLSIFHESDHLNKITRTYAGDHWAMVHTVALADFFCNAKGVSPLGVRNTATPPSQIFSALGLQKAQVNRIWEDLDDALKSADIMALIQTECP